jgi:hypothetical protein
VTADAVRARRLVEARLGRAPQDMLEAAVVLEAWAGVPAQRALESARELMPPRPAAPVVSVSSPPPARPRPGRLGESATFLVTVVAIALWAAPLAAGVGVAAVERGLKIALPLTLALQWGLRRRCLGRPGGLLELGRHRGALMLVACAVVLLPSVALGPAGTVAGLLTLTWTGGTVLIRRRWAAVYGAIVIGGTPAMLAGRPAVVVLGAIAALTTTAVFVGLRPVAGEPAAPGRWTRTAGGALLGAGLGLMLVLDSSVSWTAGSVPALALVPSTLASLWAGGRLWELEHVIPRALSGVSVAAMPARGARPAAAPLATLMGAVARLLWLTAALSVLLLALTPGDAGLLAAFGLLALATLLASLLEAMGRGGAAALSVLAAVTAETLVQRLGPAPFPGAALAVGGALAVVLLLPIAVALLARPASALATTVWIT